MQACLKVHRQCGSKFDSRDKAYSLLGWGVGSYLMCFGGKNTKFSTKQNIFCYCNEHQLSVVYFLELHNVIAVLAILFTFAPCLE